MRRKWEIVDAHQAFRHGGLVQGWEMLFEGQDDAVGDDGGKDQVLKWSGLVKEKCGITNNAIKTMTNPEHLEIQRISMAELLKKKDQKINP